MLKINLMGCVSALRQLCRDSHINVSKTILLKKIQFILNSDIETDTVRRRQAVQTIYVFQNSNKDVLRVNVFQLRVPEDRGLIYVRNWKKEKVRSWDRGADKDAIQYF